MASRSALDPTKRKPLPEIQDEFEFYTNEWRAIRATAAEDMRYVAGQPFSEDDLDARGDRPPVAPDEMTQYRVQVTNALRKAPRGAKFQPVGRGAGEKSAEFYQNKWREIEYRSHAVEHYIGSAENILQRGYGAFRIDIRYSNPRAVNPELWIDGFPDPDVVLPDPTIKLRSGLDMKGCFILETMRRTEFLKRYPGAEVRNFSDYSDRYKGWIHPGLGGMRIQVAEYWKVETRPRVLHAVMVGPENAQWVGAGQRSKPIAMFADEIEAFMGARQARGLKVLANRKIRDVDYPDVKRRITNGLEVLSTESWPGKYIPIVLMFGPILYVPDGGQTRKEILSMTRFAKAPWKSYCYACSQELEVLGQVPKASVVVYKGQLAGLEDQWEESLYTPLAFLEAHGRISGMKESDELLPLPKRLEYAQAEYLQAIELVKEGFRRAIQAAMGSNFLPTQAQRINDKSGEALRQIDEAATKGTWHFVDAYEDGIRTGGVIGEDLMDKVYDYAGETSVMSIKFEAQQVEINDPKNDQAVSTFGDHLVTVTTAPSSDSEYDAVQTFLGALLTNLGEIAGILGPQTTAYLLSQLIKMRNMGPLGDELAEAILPPQFRQQGQDGKPMDPALVGAQQKIQQLQQQLQAAENEIHSKITVEKVKGAIQRELVMLKNQATSADKAADRSVKLEVAAIQAKIETMAMVLEELERLGGLHEAQAQRMHDAGQGTLDRAHETVEKVKDRIHDRHTQHAEHHAAMAIAAQGVAGDMAKADQGAGHDAAAADQAAGHAAGLQEQAAALAPKGGE
jgi:hypothetical protein